MIKKAIEYFKTKEPKKKIEGYSETEDAFVLKISNPDEGFSPYYKVDKKMSSVERLNIFDPQVLLWLSEQNAIKEYSEI